MKRCIAGCLISIILCCFLFTSVSGTEEFDEKDRTMAFIKELGCGISIGNSLDVARVKKYHPEAGIDEYEMGWGNPRIIREHFTAIYRAGFETVRIPVSWEEHIDENGTIQNEFMDRVQEVVNMALECKLYVIINTHHEEWLNLSFDNREKVKQHFSVVWKQIATRFQDYSERLIFEGLNEPRLRESTYEWNEGTPELRSFVNELNGIFIRTVRGTMGNNRNRYLMISPYCNRVHEDSLKDLIVPDDERIIISVHLYQPSKFCHETDGFGTWNPDEEEWSKINKSFALLYEYFLSKKIPVVITEFGCADKSNIQDRIRWTEDITKLCHAFHIPYIWWDNGSSFRLLDRQTCGWVYPGIVQALTE